MTLHPEGKLAEQLRRMREGRLDQKLRSFEGLTIIQQQLLDAFVKRYYERAPKKFTDDMCAADATASHLIDALENFVVLGSWITLSRKRLGLELDGYSFQRWNKKKHSRRDSRITGD